MFNAAKKSEISITQWGRQYGTFLRLEVGLAMKWVQTSVSTTWASSSLTSTWTSCLSETTRSQLMPTCSPNYLVHATRRVRPTLIHKNRTSTNAVYAWLTTLRAKKSSHWHASTSSIPHVWRLGSRIKTGVPSAAQKLLTKTSSETFRIILEKNLYAQLLD